MKDHFRFNMLIAMVLLPILSVYGTPNAVITPAPRLPNHLSPRQEAGPNVYGYIDGDINSPMGCGAGYQFAKQSEFGACCNEATCTSAYFTCVNKGEQDPCAGESSYMCGLGMGLITALSCNSATPSCYQYMVMSSPEDTNPAYVPRCGTASTVIQVFMTATNTADATSSPDIVAGDGVSKTTSTANSRTRSISNSPEETASPSDGTDTSGASKASAPSTNPSSNDKNGSGNKMIIIIAIVVGIIVVATVVGGFFYLRKRQKVHHDKIHDPDIPSHVSVIPTNYAGSNTGRNSLTMNPVFEDPAKMSRITQWNNQSSSTDSSNDSGAIVRPTQPASFPPPLPPRKHGLRSLF